MPMRAVPVLFVLLVLTSALAACGRRGPLEQPTLSGQKPQTQTGSEAEEDENRMPPGGFVPSPVPTPRSKQTRGYTIPQKPFLLDPLL
jgi:predicted small lipoprotein YifL